MATKIPDSTSLNRRLPQANIGNVSTDIGGAGVASGIMDVASTAYKIGEREARYQSSAAEAGLMVDLMKRETEINDEDYDDKIGANGYVDKFSESAGDIVGKRAESISNPEYRSRFLNQAELVKAKAGERVRNNMFVKESAYRVGNATETLNGLRDAAITTGQVGDSYIAADNLLQSLSDNGYIDEVKRAQLSQKYKDDVATGRLDYLPPEERMGELKKIKNHMRPDTYSKYLRQAEQDNIIFQSQTSVDDYMGAYEQSGDITLGEARAAAMADIEKKYGDNPKNAALRAATEQRLDYEVNKRDKADVEHASGLFDEYYAMVLTGQKEDGSPFDVSMIPKEDFYSMKPSMQKNLFDAQASRVAPKKTGFNLSAEDQLNLHLESKNFKDLRRYFIDNAASMSESQQKKWSQVSVDGIIPGAAKSAFSSPQMIDMKTPGLNPAQRAPLKEKFNDWFFDYQQNNEGQEPSDLEINNRIDTLISEHDTAWAWGGTKPIYQMTDQEQQDAVALVANDKPEIYQDTQEYFKMLGRQPDMPEFLEKMKILEELRSGTQ